MNESIKNSFDRGSKNYDLFSDIQRETGKKLVNFFLNNLSKKSQLYKKRGFSILDLGCGTGEFSNELIGKINVKSIELLDVSSEMIKISKHKINFCKSKFSIFDFDNFAKFNEFDLVVSNMSLHWSKNILNFYVRVIKQLRPGSLFLFSIPNNSSFLSLKKIFKEYNRNFTLNRLPDTEKILKSEYNNMLTLNFQNITLKKKYKSPLVFFKELKKIGANFSENKNKQALFFLRNIKNTNLDIDYAISLFLVEKK